MLEPLEFGRFQLGYVEDIVRCSIETTYSVKGKLQTRRRKLGHEVNYCRSYPAYQEVQLFPLQDAQTHHKEVQETKYYNTLEHQISIYYNSYDH